jgi:hypothetical protein
MEGSRRKHCEGTIGGAYRALKGEGILADIQIHVFSLRSCSESLQKGNDLGKNLVSQVKQNMCNNLYVWTFGV